MKKRLTRAEKRERTYEELISAAERLFIEQGFHATSVDEIALEAGYTKGAVYSNFDSKEGLFFAVYERRADKAVAEIEQVLRENGPAASLELLASDAARRHGRRLARSLLRILGARGASPRAAREVRPHSRAGRRTDDCGGRAYRRGAGDRDAGRGTGPQCGDDCDGERSLVGAPDAA